MDSSTKTLIIIILVAILAILLSFVLSRMLLNRAMLQIIRKLRENNAVDAAKAIFAEDAGIKRRGVIAFRALRDYKPMALDILVRTNIIRVTDDGRIYLSEETLAQTKLEQKKT
jgi:hypothetical protein